MDAHNDGCIQEAYPETHGSVICFEANSTQHNLSPSGIKWDQRDQCDVQARTEGWVF